MKSLLLLIDLQRDYLASPGLEPPAGTLERRARELVRGCRELGIPVAHLWTSVTRADDRRMPHWRREDRWLCEDGTPGHRPPAGLEPLEGEAVMHKTSFMRAGGLELPAGLDRLVVAGVHLHACVRQAVIEAYARDGLEIWVAEDAVASDDPLHAAITHRYLERRAARFLTVDDALAELGGGSNGGGGGAAAAAAAAVEPVARRCAGVLDDWRRREPAERVEPLRRLADLLDPQELGRAMAEAIGKPVRYGVAEVERTAQMLRAVARRAVARDPTEPADGAQVHRRPLGVVGCITPWNSPVYISLGKIAPALAHGNAVLWKPAPAASEISSGLMSLLERAGLPAGLVGLVSGGRRAAEAVIGDPMVAAVTLTGSARAGFAAQEACARRHIPLQAELGGNNAALVWLDADLDHAASQIAEGAFGQAGQRCTANRRVVVHRDCREELIEALTRATAALAWGDPADPATVVGPLVDDRERARVADLVARAGQAIVPHEGPAPAGAFLAPAIVPCDDPSHEIVRHESFGPVLVVQGATDWDHAMELVNGVPHGLAAALFSAAPEPLERFPREALAGIVKLNRSTADAGVDVPFGGWRASGIGPPEHGEFDSHFYTRPQAVYR